MFFMASIDAAVCSMVYARLLFIVLRSESRHALLLRRLSNPSGGSGAILSRRLSPPSLGRANSPSPTPFGTTQVAPNPRIIRINSVQVEQPLNLMEGSERAKGDTVPAFGGIYTHPQLRNCPTTRY